MSPKAPGERVGGGVPHTTRLCLVANRMAPFDSRLPADAIIRSVAFVAESRAAEETHRIASMRRQGAARGLEIGE